MTYLTRRKKNEGGWMRMFTVDEERAMEYKELYENMGYEVKLERPSKDDFSELCGECASMICKTCYIIFIRRKSSVNNLNE